MLASRTIHARNLFVFICPPRRNRNPCRLILPIVCKPERGGLVSSVTERNRVIGLRSPVSLSANHSGAQTALPQPCEEIV
jgi:hypothetical protein